MNIDKCYENLANEIIVVAIRDYKNALKKIKKDPADRSAQYEKRLIERFFRSEMFDIFTSLDPDWLLERAREMV